MKPQLANDANLDTLEYPVWEQPKIDGVRAMNLQGTLTGRSLDPHKGFGITDYFSKPEFVGLDGEMTLGNVPNCTDRLCSLTTGAMGRFKGVTEMPDIHFWVFDMVNEATMELTYERRYFRLLLAVQEMSHPRVHLVPYSVCHNRAEVNAAIARNLAAGYEGTVFRNPRAKAKPGRPSKGKQELVRVKPWSDTEMRVTGLTEGNSNENEAKTNTLGRTERSSAQAGQVPNGEIGSIQGTMLADFHCPTTGNLLFAKDLPITISSGKLTVKEAAHYLANPHEIVGHVVRFQHMTHGVKDLPRFGGYISHRTPQDMS